MYCSLIKHANISQSQSLLELPKIIWLANEMTAVNYTLDFSWAFTFKLLLRDGRCLQSSLFNSYTCLIKIQKQLKVSIPEESSCIVAHENVHFPMEITKQGAQSLGIKMRSVELYLKEATNSYLCLSPACSKIARTSVKVGKTRLLALVQLQAQEQTFNWLLVGWTMIRNCWSSLRWDDRRSLLSKWAFLQ